MNLSGPYVGVVESNQDPERLGRVKARVPHVYGVPDGELGSMGINDIPWAIPAGLPAGGTAASGGIDWLPEPGDQVLVFFLDGEPEKPVWLWMMQTLDQAKALKMRDYGSGVHVQSPQRSAMTRYGHTIEFNSTSVLATTKSGYSISLVNGTPGQNNGVIQTLTPKGHLLEFDDQSSTMTMHVIQDRQEVSGGQWLAASDSMDFTTVNGDFALTIGDSWTADVANDVRTNAGGNVSVTCGGEFNVDCNGNFNMNTSGAASIVSTGIMDVGFELLNLGPGAIEPGVLGNRLVQLFNVLMLWLAGHTHSNGNDGSPTGPPLIAPQGEVQGQLNQILSKVVRLT